MTTDAKARLTRPEVEREVPCTRAEFERLITQYRHELPPFERIGLTRTWPPAIVALLRSLLAREARSKGGTL